MHLTVLGCGSMATAILTGLLEWRGRNSEQRISQITACVHSEDSARKLRRLFAQNDHINVVTKGNVSAVASADVIMLAHKPYQLQKVFGEKGMAEAVLRKKIISILMGVKAEQIYNALSGNVDRCHIIRAMPNMGARVRESMTLISDPQNVAPDLVGFTTWLFGHVGRVAEVPEATYNASAVLTGACYAYTTVAADGLLDGAVKQGLPRSLALEITIQCLKGLVGMLQEGDHLATVRESISSPAGATITGLLELERRAVRSAFADALVEATEYSQSIGERQD